MIPQTGSTPYRKHHRISTTASSSSSTNNCTFFSSQLSPVFSINTQDIEHKMCSHHTDITNVQYRRILELKHTTLSSLTTISLGYTYSILLLPRPTWHNFHLRSTSIATRQVKSAIISDLLANHISGYNQLKFQCLFHYLGISQCRELFTLESIYPKQLEFTSHFANHVLLRFVKVNKPLLVCIWYPLLMHS